ncbi:MAG: CBS domain-containing protein [Spirochaetes bacterium]|nr:CBS domain-containing protein [Spirochaetota bacterium]
MDEKLKDQQPEIKEKIENYDENNITYIINSSNLAELNLDKDYDDNKSVSPVMELLYTLLVKDVMEIEVVLLKDTWNIEKVKEVMKCYHITGAPVVNSENKIVGIISIADLLDALSSNGLHDPVTKWMTKNVITISPDVNLIKAFNLIDKYKFGRIPVVDNERHVVGIITNGIIIKKLLYQIDEMSKKTESEINVLIQKLNLVNEIKLDKPIEFKWPLKKGDFNNAGKLSSEVKKLLKKLNIDRNIIRRISVATYEAEMNVVIHSVGGYAYIYIDKDKFHAEFIDEGPGIENIELALQEGYSTAPSIARELGFGAGMGLPNIKKSVDYFDLKSAKDSPTNLTVEVYFK